MALDVFFETLGSYLTLTFIGRLFLTVFVGFLISKVFLGKKTKRRFVGYVSGLRTHPVKSCQPVTLEKAVVTKLGLEYDRQFVLLNEYGTFLTLRKLPGFVKIKQRITVEGILLEASGMPTLKLPLHMNQEDGDHCSDVTVFGLTAPGVHVSDEADDWFAKYFNIEGCKLYCFPNNGIPRYSKDKGVKVENYSNHQDTLMFADGCPVLVISNPSVHEINKLTSLELTPNIFRPNIIVSKCSPFAEERWNVIQIGSVRLQGLYPCSRCVALNVDPVKGTINENILKEMERLRPASQAPYPKIKGCIFGMNYGVRKEGIIKIGDPIYAIE